MAATRLALAGKFKLMKFSFKKLKQFFYGKMFNLYQHMKNNAEGKEQKEPETTGHDRFYQERSRTSFRKKKRRGACRRAQSAAELNPDSIAAANKRNAFRIRSVSTDKEESEEENSERAPLVAQKIDSLAKLLFNKSITGTGSGKSSPSDAPASPKTYGAVPPSLIEKIGIGMTAGAAGAFVGNPAEVALIRMTADGRLPPEQRRNYKNVFDALGRIINTEGAMTLMRGVSATITRAMVVNGAQLGSYTQAREMLLPNFGEGISLHFTASMISGLVTSIASLPVDIVKTRVQMAAKSPSAITVLKDVISNEGPLALWKGFWPTYLKIGPHTVLCFIFMEQLNALYLKLA
ncbi:mitochondrial 2-oxoglutarate/malate carrier protein-like [Hyposmocoma kahamanoa]|uniref:mitochondrial 2-oxoglutarate/malate carrier protein-like n=1 Tax=Hyposmocoma kahamanoa TaxID=1477025 RepID=UPI000E6D5F3B|nr:mitochondrial 2-oxoglutarate/malate carrier protein-like [Hyposmocoma kahamanoa]